ncbi:MAG: exported protein of unknown function [Candidatus Thorarchaeota archaeon]|nr:MAG: exported protein of unknown function [Candidatus Thorarchaeota archaeon]
MNSSCSKYSLLLAVGILMILPTISTNSNTLSLTTDTFANPARNTMTASGAQWLDGFPFRKSHIIAGSSGAGANYQVQIEIHSGTGIDAKNLVYLPSAYWTAGDPIRFTDDDGETLLDYWLETSEAESATYWVEIKDNLDENVEIYLYYGNPSAGSLSNGTATFLFFDDFENGNLDRWDSADSAWGCVTSEKKYGSYSGYFDQTASGRIDANLSTSQTGVMIHTWYRTEALRGGSIRFYGSENGDTEAARVYEQRWTHYNGTNYIDYGSRNKANNEDWELCEVGINLDEGVMMLWSNSTFIGETTEIKNITGTSLSASEEIYRIRVDGQTNYQVWLDNYYVRKWISEEPQHGDWKDGANWLDDFPYRKKHMINGVSGAGTNYQIKIRIHSGTGTDTGDLVNIDSDKWSTSDPIRFTGKDGVTLLDCWKESSSGSYATYWVEIQDSLDNDIAIYVYYGNNSVSALSNGSATFLSWDDFDEDYTTGDAPKSRRGWFLKNKGTGDDAETATAPVGGSGDALKYYNDGTGDLLKIGNSWGTNYDEVAVRFDFYYDTQSYGWLFEFLAGVGQYNGWIKSDTSDSYQVRYDNMNFVTPSLTLSADTWYSFEFYLEYNTVSFKESSTTYSAGYANTANQGTERFEWGTTSTSGQDLFYFDNFYVRKYVSSGEPTHGDWGAEERKEGPEKADGAPWLEGWPFRRYHRINGSTGAGTGYQVEIVINSGTGTDSGNLLNIPSSEWVPSLPVRFTDNDGTTLLNYWKASENDNNATYWVKIDDNLDYDTLIYIYYGNSSKESLSNGTATFLFFDDFENGNLDRWDSVGGSWECITNEVKHGRFSASFDQTLGGSISANLSSFTGGIMVHSWYRAETYRGGDYVAQAIDSGELSAVRAHEHHWRYWDGTSYVDYGSENGVTALNWDRIEVGIDLASYSMRLWVNGTYIGSASEINNLSGENASITDMLYGLRIAGQTNYQHWMDDVFVRKYIVNEPHHDDWLDEESPSIDSPSDIEYNEGDSGYDITWSPSDSHPAKYTVFKNETEIQSGIWNLTTTSIATDVDSLSCGIYNFTIQVMDAGENTISDTVYVTVNDITDPTIDNPGDITYDEGDTGYSITWDPSDTNPSSYEIFRNESSIRSGLWNTSIETISIDVDGLTFGTYNFTLSVADIAGNTATDTVWVTVEDGLSPSVSNPDDIEYGEFSVGYNISWDPEDVNPSSFEVFKNGVSIASGSWNDTEEIIQITVDNLTIGTYNFTLIVFDISGKNATDTVWVTVIDGTSPTLDSPNNISYPEGDIGNSIEWDPEDQHPYNYTVYRNGTVIATGLWNSTNEVVNISIDYLEQGIYNFTIQVTDIGSNTAIDLVWVTVDDESPPSLNSPSNRSIEGGADDEYVSWNPTDLHPTQYEVYMNITLVSSGTWNSTSPIQVEINTTLLGVFNYTIIVFDIGQNNNTDTVWITIEDTTVPDINIPPATQYESNSTGNSITWIASDLYPVSFELYVNNALTNSSIWNGGNIQINIDELALGIHNHTLVVYDEGGNNASTTVWVTVVDTTAPTITHPEDIDYFEGNTTVLLNWTPSDVNPAQYEIYRNNSLIQSGQWNQTDEIISINVGGLTLGVYNLTIVCYDEGANYVQDMVYVSVDDNTPPIIDEPSDIVMDEGDTGNDIQWDPTDLHPISYTITRNGTEVRSGAWNDTAETISISLNGLSYGQYVFILNVSDIGGNTATDTVLVSILDGTAPEITNPDDIEYESGSVGNLISWSATDLHPTAFYIFQDTILVNTSQWDGSDVEINVDGLSLGSHNYTIVFSDIGGNNASATVWVTVVDTTNPTVSHPEDIVYSEGNQSVYLNWSLYDLNPQNYTIYKNGTPIQSDSWMASDLEIGVQVGDLDYGLYNFTIIAFDQAELNSIDMVWITVIDTTSPILDAPEDIYYAEGATGNSVEWNPDDLHPLSYQSYLDNSPYVGGTWNSTTENISIDIDGLTLGTYNLTLVIVDIDGNIASDQVDIYVFDNENPSVVPVDDFVMPEGSQDFDVQWTLLDLNPKNYSVLLNGTEYQSGIWNESAETVNIGLDEFSIGNYNLSILVFDQDENSAVDMVIFSVFDGTAPVIQEQEDMEIEDGSIGNYISWQPSDLHPFSYTIYMNSSKLIEGSWNSSSDIIQIHLDGYPLGTYNMTVIVLDVGNNKASDEVWIFVVDTTNPVAGTSNQGSSIQFEMSSTGNVVSWSPSDHNPGVFQILVNQSVVKEGLWNTTGETISFSMDEWDLGLYNITLKIIDTSGNSDSSQILVTIYDGVSPTINQPIDVSFTFGSRGYSITWTPHDQKPGYYWILRNGTEIASEEWLGSSITVSFDGLDLGVWNYTIVVEDTSSNRVKDTVFVTVLSSNTSTETATTTTSLQPNPLDDAGVIMAIVGSTSSIGIVGIILGIYIIRRRQKSRELISTEKKVSSLGADAIVQVMRGGEFVGNRFRFKVKILNKSPLVITDISVTLVSYPRDSLVLEGETSKIIPKLDPEGFRSPSFDLLPTQDCVKGDLIASVTYVDSRGRAHSIMSEPFTIRAVCDLLSPEVISVEEYMLKLATLGHGEMALKVEDWTPEQMHEKTLQILRNSNFFEVDSKIEHTRAYIESRIKGWAKGIYTGKNLGVEIVITGRAGIKGATCKVTMSGEDNAMIMPAIDEITKKLGAWLCPKCGAALPFDSVEVLKKGKSVACPFCGVTMDR